MRRQVCWSQATFCTMSFWRRLLPGIVFWMGLLFCTCLYRICVFSFKEEREKTRRATKGKIYVLYKQIFPLCNNNKPNVGSFMGVGDWLGDVMILVEEPKGHFPLLRVIKTCCLRVPCVAARRAGVWLLSCSFLWCLDASGRMRAWGQDCLFKDSTCGSSLASPELKCRSCREDYSFV